MFSLHPTLANDCFILGNFPLSQLLMMNDNQYPWFILVPQRDNIKEVYQLSEEDQQQLNKESCHLAKVLADAFKADKINVAALGNVVPQLHIHHIVRHTLDSAWPMPVWGQHAPIPYTNQEQRIDHVRNVLGTALGFIALD